MPSVFLKRSFTLAALLLTLGVGCVQFSGAPSGGADGGVFKSVDKAASWTQKSAIASVGAPRSFAGLNVSALAQDPGDPRALYAGSDTQGLFYSLDAGESWHHAETLGRLPVSAVVVNPQDKCVVLVAVGNRIHRTSDCVRTWQNVYVDPRPDALIRDIVFDHFTRGVVFAGSSKGDLLRSGDGGDSWSPVHRFENDVTRLLMSSRDSRVMYVATRNRGLWRTSDAGANWTDLTPNLGEFSGATENILLAEDPSAGDALVMASNYGLLRTTDGGASWQAIPLLTPPRSTVIHSLAVSPKDSRAIYYGTGSTYYRTSDGGVKWVTSGNPTSRAPTALMVDNVNDSVLYMGTTLLRQRTGF